MWNVLALGLVNWIATTIVVESELTRPVREFFDRVWHAQAMHHGPDSWQNSCAYKLRYLCACHLCAGTWVALAEAAVLGSPWGGAGGFIAGALLYKAVGHLVLELRPQAWLPRPQGGS